MNEIGQALAQQGDTPDIRSKALENMTAEIDRLTAKVDQIVASAFQTSAATDQVHRAILKLASARNRSDFIITAETTICPILRIPMAKVEERYVRVLTLNGLTAELPLDDGNVLVLTGPEPDFYAPSQGTDLLRFFHSVIQKFWATCPD